MSYKFRTVYSSLALLFALFLLISFSSNPPQGNTGAPGDGLCTNCHGGSNPNGYNGDIIVTGLPATVVGGDTYNLTATVNVSAGSPSRAGFQFLALNSNNNNAGDLSSASSNPTTQTLGGREYIEHNPAKTFGGGSSVSWSFDWEAPIGDPAGTNYTFYAAAVLGNGSGSGNDEVITNQTTAQMGGGVALSVSINETNVTCFEDNDGSATVSGNGGVPPYTFIWSNGGNTATINNLAAGTYNVTINDAAGSSLSASAIINQPPALNIAILNSTNISCIVPQGSATVVGSGGTPSYSFAWSSGATGATATNLLAGANTVTITDAVGCMETQVVMITQNTTAPIASAGNSMSINCNNDCVTLNGTGSTATNTSVVWTTINGVIQSGANTFTPEVCASGTYQIEVTNLVNGCSATDLVIVTEDLVIPTSNAGDDKTLNCNTTSVTLDGSNSTQGVDINYSWTTLTGNIVSGENSLTPVVNASGLYTLTCINNMNGCFSTDEVLVSQIIPPSVTITNQTDVDCNGNATGSATIAGFDGNPSYTYTWSSGGTTATETNLVAGIYGFTITDTDNCEASGMITISEPDALTVNGISTNETSTNANDGTAEANPIGGIPPYSYNWSNSATTQSIDNLSPGNYSVIVTDANNCTTSETLTVGSFDCSDFAASIVVTDNLCNGDVGGTATVTVLGGADPVSYLWSTGGTASVEENLSAGTYSVSSTDANNCEIVNTVTISEPAPLFITLTNVTAVICEGEATGTASVMASGGTSVLGNYNFVWPSGNTSPNEGALAPGIYTVTVSDDNDCIATLDVEIEQGVDTELPIVIAENITVSLDAAGIATITAQEVDGGSNDNCGITEIYLDLEDFDCSNLGTNTVILAALDANMNCGKAEATVTVIDEINPTIVCPDNLIIQGCDGILVSYDIPEATDNCEVISIEFLEGVISGEAFPLGETVITYQAEDVSGNISACSFMVTIEDSDLEIAIDQIENATNNDNNGSIDITVSGGIAPYEYEWHLDGVFFSNEEDLNDLAAGTYDLIVTDANGCVVSELSIIVDMETGLAELEKVSQFSVFPNPNRGDFIINMRLHQTENIQIEIMNLRGEIVSQTISEKGKGRDYFISLSHLPEGVYFSRITIGNESEIVKIIKTN